MLVVRPYPDRFSWSWAINQKVVPYLAARGCKIVPRRFPFGEKWLDRSIRGLASVYNHRDERVLFLDPLVGFELYALGHPDVYLGVWTHFTPPETGWLGQGQWSICLRRAWMSRADVVFANSAVEEEYDRSLGARHIYRLTCPVDFRPRSLKRWEERDIDVLIVARDDPIKRVEEAKRIAMAAGAEHVVWADRRYSRRQLQSLYNRSKVLLSASLHEGFGVAIAEAAIMGCGIVVYPAGIWAEWASGDDRVLFRDFEAGVECVRRELASGDIAKEGKYRRLVEYHCRPERIAEQLLAGMGQA